MRIKTLTSKKWDLWNELMIGNSQRSIAANPLSFVWVCVAYAWIGNSSEADFCCYTGQQIPPFTLDFAYALALNPQHPQ